MSIIFPNIPIGVLQIFKPEDQREIRRYLLAATAASAIHTHDNDAESGQLDENAFLFTPGSTTSDATITTHGFLPQLSGAANEFLDGDGTFDSVKDADLSMSTGTANDATITTHGFLPKLSGAANKFLDGEGIFDFVKDADLSTTDITTNDVSTSKHGFCPKGDNNTTHFLRGDATWTIALCSAMTIYNQAEPPDLGANTCALWIDSDAGPKYYFLADFGGTQKMVELNL